MDLQCEENKILAYTRTIKQTKNPAWQEEVDSLNKEKENWIEDIKEPFCIEEDIVAYSYDTGIEEPADKGEEISKRTRTTKFFKKETNEKGQVWEAKIGHQSRFKKEDTWFKIGYAKIPLEDWNNQISEDKQT